MFSLLCINLLVFGKQEDVEFVEKDELGVDWKRERVWHVNWDENWRRKATKEKKKQGTWLTKATQRGLNGTERSKKYTYHTTTTRQRYWHRKTSLWQPNRCSWLCDEYSLPKNASSHSTTAIYSYILLPYMSRWKRENVQRNIYWGHMEDERILQSGTVCHPCTQMCRWRRRVWFCHQRRKEAITGRRQELELNWVCCIWRQTLPSHILLFTSLFLPLPTRVWALFPLDGSLLVMDFWFGVWHMWVVLGWGISFVMVVWRVYLEVLGRVLERVYIRWCSGGYTVMLVLGSGGFSWWRRSKNLAGESHHSQGWGWQIENMTAIVVM